MKTFSKAFKESTLVKIHGDDAWLKIASIHESRQWIKVQEYEGCFQRGHISAYTNKKG